jgi:hypothetical protein
MMIPGRVKAASGFSELPDYMLADKEVASEPQQCGFTRPSGQAMISVLSDSGENKRDFHNHYD